MSGPKLGIPVCLFDFRGSGLSEGSYVSYGYFERHDLHEVIETLRRHDGFDSFVLWGRSMGAATALMYAANPGARRLLLTIADSSYYDFRELLEEIGNTKMGIPMFLVRPLLYMLESRVKSKAGFDLSDIHMGSFMKTPHCPIAFVAAKCDSVVPIEHSEKLYRDYKGSAKELFYIERDHQHEREQSEMNHLLRLIQKAISREKLAQNPALKQSMLLSRRGTAVVPSEQKLMNRCGSTNSLASEADTQTHNDRGSHYRINVLSSRRGSTFGLY